MDNDNEVKPLQKLDGANFQSLTGNVISYLEHNWSLTRARSLKELATLTPVPWVQDLTIDSWQRQSGQYSRITLTSYPFKTVFD